MKKLWQTSVLTVVLAMASMPLYADGPSGSQPPPTQPPPPPSSSSSSGSTTSGTSSTTDTTITVLVSLLGYLGL